MGLPELYLDAAATTPPLPAVIAVMQHLQETAWANPSSLHGAGLTAAEALERARWRMAERFGVDADQLIVTSGATESVHLALLGSAAGLPPGRLVISAVEHPAVIAAAHQLETLGWSVAEWPVDGQGVVRLDQLERLLSAPTRLVSLIAAQGEVGALQPVIEIAKACRERGIVIHSDATQLVPQGCFPFERLGVDLLTLSAHKFRGPRGVGLLIRAPGVALSPLLGGGGQEHGLRSGTEPVALVCGMAEALMALPSFDPVTEPVPPGCSIQIRRQRDQLLQRLLELPQLQLCGPALDQRLPHHIALLAKTTDGQPLSGRELVRRLAAVGVACSSGSACSSGTSSDSAVLKAMGIPGPERQSGLRLTLGPWLSDQDLDAVPARFASAFKALS
ncbi:MAG: aminotransferase class V-fold PLP-dependent enzyme [Synechococcus sp. BS301-5m-G53]|nr:aminotransferase class V-fold PLP-dependent enzyme [Synechococcus sp. BS301-5m-G53]